MAVSRSYCEVKSMKLGSGSRRSTNTTAVCKQTETLNPIIMVPRPLLPNVTPMRPKYKHFTSMLGQHFAQCVPKDENYSHHSMPAVVQRYSSTWIVWLFIILSSSVLAVDNIILHVYQLQCSIC